LYGLRSIPPQLLPRRARHHRAGGRRGKTSKQRAGIASVFVVGSTAAITTNRVRAWSDREE